MSGVPLLLSQTRPDFQSLVLQLQLYLSTKATWVDQQTSGTGQSIVEMVSAVGAFNQFAGEVHFREAFIQTARRDSSIYAGADFLGVHVDRKIPAKTEVVLTRTGNVTSGLLIPRLSSFQIDGTPFFNREPISFAPGSANSIPAFLYAGTVQSQTFTGTGAVFQELTLNEPGFSVSDKDVYVYVTNTSTGVTDQWVSNIEGIFVALPDEKAFYDRTNGFGDVILTFGDGIHGSIPSLGLQIKIFYAITTGSQGNNGGSGLQVVYQDNTNIKGITTTSIVGGADEKPSSYYKVLAPRISNAKGRAVNDLDYQALTLAYPGVASAVVKAQKDIAPNDIRWMNVVRICILPFQNDAFLDAEWDDFFEYFQKLKHAAVMLQKYNPIKLSADVSIRVGMVPNAIPGEVYPVVEANIRALFARGQDSLGRRIARSDIVDASKIEDVDYVQLLEPTSDLYVDPISDPTGAYVFWEIGSLQIELFYSERKSVRR